MINTNKQSQSKPISEVLNFQGKEDIKKEGNKNPLHIITIKKGNTLRFIIRKAKEEISFKAMQLNIRWLNL